MSPSISSFISMGINGFLPQHYLQNAAPMIYIEGIKWLSTSPTPGCAVPYSGQDMLNIGSVIIANLYYAIAGIMETMTRTAPDIAMAGDTLMVIISIIIRTMMPRVFLQ